jgi:hypothetical protein
MSNHRNPRKRLSPAPTFEIPAALDLLREVIGRADAMACAAERHFERFGWRCTDDDAERPLEHLAHLLGAAREAVSSAVELGTTIAAELVRRGGAP